MSGDFDNLWNIRGVWSVLYIVGGAFVLAVLIILVWCLIQVIRPMFYCCKISYCTCCLCGPCASNKEDSFERDMKIEHYTGIFEEALAMHERARYPYYEEEDEVREKRKRRSSHSESDTVGRPALHSAMSEPENEHLLSIIEEDDMDDDNVFFSNSEDSEYESDESDRDSWGGRSERRRRHHGSSLTRLDHAASAAMKAVRKKFTSKKPFEQKGLGQRRDGQLRTSRQGRQMRHAHGARAARMRTGSRAHKAGRTNRTSKPAARQKNRQAANKKGSAGRSKKRSSGSKSSGRSRRR